MENTTTQNGGFYMLTEDLGEEFKKEAARQTQTKEQKEKFSDAYDFYPDSSF